MKKFSCSIFIVILLLPTILGLTSKLSGKTFDVTLNGYIDNTDKPTLSIKTFSDGSFQSQYAAWYGENFQPRGVLTKNYKTIQFNLFQLDSSRIVGKDNDIFEVSYINAELCINGASDFSLPENQQAMQEYVKKLELLQEKLSSIGKTLYVVLTPNKADSHKENIPNKYFAMSNDSSISGEDYLAYLLGNTDIPHLICKNMEDSLAYPPFYCSGIHWSRTFAQTALARILADLNVYTGKNYPSIELGEVSVQNTPFGGDADVLDLCNVWNPYTETYYQYDMCSVYPESYDKLGILFQGTSFSDILRTDFSNVLPLENCFYINRNSYIQSSDGLKQISSFDDVDFSNILNLTDVIVVECLPPEISTYSYGFVDALLSELETYVPYHAPYMTSLDTESEDQWD